ncbi:MAG: hypothetical protein OHK0039_16340 [Bacteroidia bacterium]
MKRRPVPILSYFAIQGKSTGLQLELLLIGICVVALGLAANYWFPDLCIPVELYAGLGALSVLMAVLTYFVSHFRKHIFDYAFIVFVLGYLATIFLSFTNRLIPEFVTILIAVHILFSVSFRHRWEYVIFAVSSMVLFAMCSLLLPNLVTGPDIFLPMIGFATVFSGLYLWSQQQFLEHLNSSSDMLEDLLDSSIFAIFLLDPTCTEIIYQNRIGDSFLENSVGKKRLAATDLLRLLGLEAFYITRRFQAAGHELKEKSYYSLNQLQGQRVELELYVSKVRTLQADNILLKVRDITEIKDQERSLNRSRSVNASLIHALPDILVTLGADDTLRSVQSQPHLEALLPLSSYTGRNLHLLVRGLLPQTQREPFLRHIRQARETGLLQHVELHIPGKGREHFFELRIVRLNEDLELLVIIRDVTEAKAVEKALKQSEQNYREIFNTGTEGILILDPETQTIRDANQIICSMLGLTQADLYDQAVTTICETSDVVKVLQFLRHILEGGQQLLECRLRREGLRPVDVELSAKLTLLGGDFRLMLLVRDISERVEKRQALESSEARVRLFRSLINQSSDVIFVLDAADGRVLDFNDRLPEVLGYTDEALRMCSFADFTGIDGGQVPDTDWLAGLRKMQQAIYTGRLQRTDGSSFPVEFNMRHVRTDERSFVVGVARDLSERLAQAEALRQSEQRYRTLVEKMNEGLVLADLDEQILFVNDRMCEMLGITREEMMGKRTYEAFGGGDELRRIIEEKAQLRVQGISDQYELYLERRDGRALWVLITGSPYEDAGGQLIGTLAIITDITTRKQVEIKLKEKNDELDAFVYKASHDLKGPLASVLGVTNIARGEVQDVKANRYLDLIAKSTKRLDLILSELIDVTRINKADLQPQPVDVAALADEILQSLEHLPQVAQIDFEVDVHQPEPFVSDRRLLQSVLQNLLVNSINYHNPEAVPPRVSLHARPIGDQLEIVLADNGIGIPESMQQKVFEMFFRGNTQSKGSGLGLYIVKNAVEKMQGTVRLSSQPGVGTTFTLLLPSLTPVVNGVHE